jgi:hypothetical protein
LVSAQYSRAPAKVKPVFEAFAGCQLNRGGALRYNVGLSLVSYF